MLHHYQETVHHHLLISKLSNLSFYSMFLNIYISWISICFLIFWYWHFCFILWEFHIWIYMEFHIRIASFSPPTTATVSPLGYHLLFNPTISNYSWLYMHGFKNSDWSIDSLSMVTSLKFTVRVYCWWYHTVKWKDI